MRIIWPFKDAPVGKPYHYRLSEMRPAKQAARNTMLNCPGMFFSFNHTARDAVTITREVTEADARKMSNKRVDRKNNMVWPFISMLPNEGWTAKGKYVRPALERLRSLKIDHPELFFSIIQPTKDMVIITKVLTAEEVVIVTPYRKWPYKGAAVGDSFEFDMTFMSQEFAAEDAVKVRQYAHTYATSKGWKMQCRTTTTPDGRKVITVTRVK